MKIGIIGYGSMGKMLLEKLSQAENLTETGVFVANRTYEKIQHLNKEHNVCKNNKELADIADIIFVCVRPVDLKEVLTEIKDSINKDKIIVSLNGSITFEQIESICKNKIAKVIPSVTAEINKSQTLICYNSLIQENDKQYLNIILRNIGDVIELPETEMGMGSELVSCMPGFISAIFDVICKAAKKHTDIPENDIVQMVLQTMIGTGELMLKNGYSYEDVISRVATKGGITEEGTRVIYEQLPEIADAIFDKTLEKRKQTTLNAQKIFK